MSDERRFTCNYPGCEYAARGVDADELRSVTALHASQTPANEDHEVYEQVAAWEVAECSEDW